MRSFKPWTLLEHGGRDYAFSGIVRPVARFIKTEQLSSIILLAATAAALIWVNSPFDHEYFEFWHTELGFDAGLFGIHLTLEEWVNDGLMAVFFFVIGLEIKREVVHGELREPRKAALPVMAAIGGMIVPALIFFAFNGTGEDGRGWGIPLATDIAFALGVLALLGRFLPAELRIFLLALAVVDDIGSILVIAVFYTDSVDVQALGWGVLLLGAMVAAYRSAVGALDSTPFLASSSGPPSKNRASMPPSPALFSASLRRPTRAIALLDSVLRWRRWRAATRLPPRSTTSR